MHLVGNKLFYIKELHAKGIITLKGKGCLYRSYTILLLFSSKLIYSYKYILAKSCNVGKMVHGMKYK